MAMEDMDAAPDKEHSGSWRRGWASAGAIVATIALILLVVMVTRARDEALRWERHTYDVMLLTRTVDATMARSEAALGRFVLDEEQTTGSLYYNEWRRAGRQIGQLRRLVREPEQRQRVEELTALYNERGAELAAAAIRAATKRDSGGVPLFYQAGLSPTGPALRAKLDEIATNEQQRLRERMAETRMFDEEADKFTEWLGWLGVLIGIGAIVLGLLAYRAITERLVAREEADTESNRAMALERAVLVGKGTPAEELASDGGAVAVDTVRDAVATATRNLLDDSVRRAELGAHARSVVQRDYDARRMTAAYEAIYDELK